VLRNCARLIRELDVFEQLLRGDFEIDIGQSQAGALDARSSRRALRRSPFSSPRSITSLTVAPQQQVWLISFTASMPQIANQPMTCLLERSSSEAYRQAELNIHTISSPVGLLHPLQHAGLTRRFGDIDPHVLKNEA